MMIVLNIKSCKSSAHDSMRSLVIWLRDASLQLVLNVPFLQRPYWNLR